MENTNIENRATSEIIWFCNECLISVVNDPQQICIICEARHINLAEFDKDILKRNLLVFFVACGIVGIAVALLMAYLK